MPLQDVLAKHLGYYLKCCVPIEKLVVNHWHKSNGTLAKDVSCPFCHKRINSDTKHADIDLLQAFFGWDTVFDMSRPSKWGVPLRQNFEENYPLYLQSAEWKKRRDWVLSKANLKCKMCHMVCTDKATEVHHLTYDRVGAEAISDLVAVCSPCHRSVHQSEEKGNIR